MPIEKPQYMKSIHTIGLQPQKMTEKIQVIMCMDLAGKQGVDIANELGLTQSRVSIIRNSPLYKTQLSVEREKLKELYREKQTDKLITGDPVESFIKERALDSVKRIYDLVVDGKSEMVSLAAAKDIADRAGYKAFTEKTVTTVEVTEKMADRFERALKYEPADNERTTKVVVKKEVSE